MSETNGLIYCIPLDCLVSIQSLSLHCKSSALLYILSLLFYLFKMIFCSRSNNFFLLSIFFFFVYALYVCIYQWKVRKMFDNLNNGLDYHRWWLCDLIGDSVSKPLFLRANPYCVIIEINSKTQQKNTHIYFLHPIHSFYSVPKTSRYVLLTLHFYTRHFLSTFFSFSFSWSFAFQNLLKRPFFLWFLVPFDICFTFFCYKTLNIFIINRFRLIFDTNGEMKERKRAKSIREKKHINGQMMKKCTDTFRPMTFHCHTRIK